MSTRMYHDDIHPAVSGNDMWSDFCTLVFAAVRLSQEQQEESLKRIFCRFPRKTRSSVAKRRHQQQSPMLFDLNEFSIDSETQDPQPHLPLMSSSCVTAADSEAKTQRNPSSATTETKDSLNPNSPCSDLSLCLLPGNTSRKRRAVKERKRAGGYKKAKVAPLSLPTAREMPEWLVKVMRDMNGARDAKLIFQKNLFVTDVNPTQNRLSMPFNNSLITI